jgi:ribonuclease BN (tRNA processing enzyme)
MIRQLTILGGAGWFPAFGRQTACALLRDGDSAIMVDAGTGVGRLMERPALLAGVARLDILLTHFHLDHISGLAYLPALGVCEQTTVWGPGATLYGTPTSELVGRVSHEPFHPVPLAAQHIEVRDLPAGELELAGVRIATRRQNQHSAPSLGFRFDDTLAWITDTAYDPASAPFAQGCRMLAHEAWYTEAKPRNPDIHSSARHAGSVAAAADVERLLLIHLPPFQAGVEALHEEAHEAFAQTSLAFDGLDLSLDASGRAAQPAETAAQ